MDQYRSTEGPGKKRGARLGTRDGWEGLTRSPRRNSVESSPDELCSVDGGQTSREVDSQIFATRLRAQNLKATQFRNPNQLSSDKKLTERTDGVSLSVEFLSSQSSRQ